MEDLIERARLYSRHTHAGLNKPARKLMLELIDAIEKKGDTQDEPSPTVVGTGSPACLKLEVFGDWIWKAFGTPAYLVGSSAVSKKWRDVDIRLILDDAEYAQWFKDEHGARDPLWTLLCGGVSELGKAMTGLPIDFQIQSQTHANKHYGGGVRHALGVLHTYQEAQQAGPPQQEKK